jgi:PKD repeat protein
MLIRMFYKVALYSLGILFLGIGLTASAPIPPPPGSAGSAPIDQAALGSDASTAPQAVLAAGDWSIDCADCPKDISAMSDRSLHLDASGRPHIAYGSENLYYAWFDGSAWQYITVDETIGTGGVASLDLGASGYAYISYWDNRNQEVKFARQDSSGWQITVIDQVQGNWDCGTSIVLDGAEYPHLAYIAYNQSGDQELRYAFQDIGGWHYQMVDSSLGFYCGRVSIALDGNAYAHISYHDYENGDLKYAFQDATGWHTLIVDDAGESGYYSSLALDAAGYAHISYSSSDPADSVLKYAYQDNAGWHLEMVDSDGVAAGPYNSLALDDAGYAHISYVLNTCPGPCANLRYAYQDSGGWHRLTLDSQGDTGWGSSLALDAAGYAHISYYGNAIPLLEFEGDLHYIYQDAGGWHAQLVDQIGDAGQYASMKLDADGWAHISYYEAFDKDLKYAYQDAGGWNTETVDSSGDVGKSSALALDSSGNAYISYARWPGGALLFAFQDTAGWITQTVDNVASYDISLAIDDGGYAHILYLDGTNSDLKYAYQDGGGWNFEIVDAAGGNSNAMVLDSAGQPHVSYIRDQNLIYAYRDNAGWHSRMVENMSGYGDTSLVLDKDERPHIIYHSDNFGSIVYVFWDAGGWILGNVGVPDGSYLSLALDEMGYPHFSYYDPDNYYLGYAYEDVTGWYTQTVDQPLQGGNVGEYTSLALDQDGLAHISYYDRVYKDLKVATYQPDAISGLVASSDSPTEFDLATTLSASVSTGSDVHYVWDFGDGTSGTGAQTSHVYPLIGQYTATVTAFNTLGMVTATVSVTITDRHISGLAAASDSPTELGQITSFSAGVTTGTNVTYSWDFGDGTHGSGANATHIYPAVGNYIVTLTASNTAGVETATIVVGITDIPITGLVAFNDGPAPIGHTIRFTASVTTGSNVIFNWDFGDGAHGTGANVSHIYSSAADYQVKVTALNGAGSLSATTEATVHNNLYYFLPMIKR